VALLLPVTKRPENKGDSEMKLFAKWTTVVLFALTACVVVAQDPAPQVSTKEVMAQAHKPPGNLLRKVATGNATDAEKAQLLKLYQALAANAPPRGAQESWSEKTGLLVGAAQAAVDGAPDAGAQLTKASNCMGCHNAHK
jgi:hypothetical protein